MLLNCDVGEDSWEFLGLQGDQINPEYSLEGQMLKLKLQYFDHLIQRTDSLKKTLMLGKIEGKRRGWQRMRWLDGIFDSMDISLCKLNSGWDGWMASSTWRRWVLPSSRSWWWPGKPGVLQSMGLQRVGHDWATELKANKSHIPFQIHASPTFHYDEKLQPGIWRRMLLYLEGELEKLCWLS